MSVKSNVIDFKKFKKAKGKAPSQSKTATAPVLDMTERRQEIITDERRKVRRTILTEFIGAYAVVPGRGLMKVALYDISDNGLAFDLEDDAGHFKSGEEIAMRVYLNQQTYFPFDVTIQNFRNIEDENVTRHGAKFAKGNVNEQALFHFIKFIETVSASLQRD